MNTTTRSNSNTHLSYKFCRPISSTLLKPVRPTPSAPSVAKMLAFRAVQEMFLVAPGSRKSVSLPSSRLNKKIAKPSANWAGSGQAEDHTVTPKSVIGEASEAEKTFARPDGKHNEKLVYIQHMKDEREQSGLSICPEHRMI